MILFIVITNNLFPRVSFSENEKILGTRPRLILSATRLVRMDYEDERSFFTTLIPTIKIIITPKSDENRKKTIIDH